jgi:short-subunit dehydrogenase
VDLTGRTALLTGATGGLGRSIAGSLAERGATLVLSARKREELERFAEELPGSGHRVAASDLAAPGAAEKLAGDVGEIDVLVANAGMSGSGLVNDFEPGEMERTLRVNLEAPMVLAQALAPAMERRGEGHLVFVASLAGKAASPRSSVYNATKFGLRGFALGLRVDLAPSGVGVSVVSPGFIREAGMFAASGAKAPPGLGTSSPGDVAAAVVRAIERNKLEVAVAPLRQRAMAHVGLAAPGLAERVQSGGVARRAAAGIDAGHRGNG